MQHAGCIHWPVWLAGFPEITARFWNEWSLYSKQFFFCWFFFLPLQSTSSYLVLLFVFHFFDVFYSVCCLLIVYQFKVTYSRNTTAKMWCNKFILSSSSFFAKAQEVYICTAEGCRTDIQLHFYCAADVADFKGKRYILYFWWRTDIEK